VVDSTARDEPSRPVAPGLWFLFRAAVEAPLTEASHEGVDPETGNTEERVPGFADLTRTCDLVRSCAERPFVEIAPLAAVSDEHGRNIERCRQPRYASLPGLADRRLVVDLDRVMTVEKGVVAQWTRVAGCATDAERRSFAAALRA